jgi:hypothetical protein
MSFALKDLRERWDEATSLWTDIVAQEFEKNHLAPLERQATTAARGMDKIAEVLQKVRQECSDRE